MARAVKPSPEELMQSRQPKRKEGEVVQTSCTLPRDAYDKLKGIAERDERSISAMIARAVKEFIERDEKRAK